MTRLITLETTYDRGIKTPAHDIVKEDEGKIN